MKPEEIKKMKLEETGEVGSFAVGDSVSIEEGPLKGFVGTVKSVNAQALKATVSTTMFGRETDVDVEFVQMKKVEGDVPETQAE